MKNREYYASELAKAVAEGNACKFKKERVHNALDCGGIDCKQCAEKAKQWLDQEANVKPRITRAEYDILDVICIVLNHRVTKPMEKTDFFDHTITEMKNKGYFEDLGEYENIYDYLRRCEVVDDD